jgi:hypothetical protein
MAYNIPNSFFRVTAIANIIAAVLMTAGFFLHPAGEDATYGTDPFWIPAHGLLWLADTIALLGWVGLFILQSANAGKFGVVAFITLLLSTSLSSWIFSSDVTLVPVIAAESPGLFKKIYNHTHIAIGLVSVLTWVLGNVLFGISIIKSKIFLSITGVLLIVGIVIIPIAYLLSFSIKFIAFGATLTAIGQGWLGIDTFHIVKKREIYEAK